MMEIPVAQYAKVHKLAIRTAYRQVCKQHRVASGDKVVRHGKRYAVLCAHAAEYSSNGMAKRGSCQPSRAKQPSLVTTEDDDHKRYTPFELLTACIRSHGLSDPGEIAFIIDEFAQLSTNAQMAISGVSDSLDVFVEQRHRHEISLREAVLSEGRLRQSLSTRGCDHYDRPSGLCDTLKSRTTGRPCKPLAVNCALCRFYERRGSL